MFLLRFLFLSNMLSIKKLSLSIYTFLVSFTSSRLPLLHFLGISCQFIGMFAQNRNVKLDTDVASYDWQDGSTKDVVSVNLSTWVWTVPMSVNLVYMESASPVSLVLISSTKEQW